MAFKWKDRSGAVHQAAYQFRNSRAYVQDLIQKMTPEEIEHEKKVFGEDWQPRFNAKDTLLDCASMALGTGTKFVNYYCLDPERMKGRQWTQFFNDVQKEIERRDYMDKFFAEHQSSREKSGVQA